MADYAILLPGEFRGDLYRSGNRAIQDAISQVLKGLVYQASSFDVQSYSKLPIWGLMGNERGFGMGDYPSYERWISCENTSVMYSIARMSGDAR